MSTVYGVPKWQHNGRFEANLFCEVHLTSDARNFAIVKWVDRANPAWPSPAAENWQQWRGSHASERAVFSIGQLH
jgi:hypothetical protein